MTGRAPRLLLVDDSARVADVFSLILACAGFSSHTARTATHALDRLARRPYAAIISDAELPGFPAGDWVTALRGAAPMTPLVVYSALGQELRCAAALGAGVVLDTPVTPDRLLATVCDVIEREPVRTGGGGLDDYSSSRWSRS